MSYELWRAKYVMCYVYDHYVWDAGYDSNR